MSDSGEEDSPHVSEEDNSPHVSEEDNSPHVSEDNSPHVSEEGEDSSQVSGEEEDLSHINEDDSPHVNEDSDSPHIAGNEEAVVPADINLGSKAVEIALHPSKDVLAAGTINGKVKIYSYSADRSRSNHKLMTFINHKESCRAVKFSETDDYLFTGSSDACAYAIDLNIGIVTRKLSIKDGAAIYCLLPIDNFLLASGDDDGQLVVWDFRMQTPIMTVKNCSEYISCFAMGADRKTLLATSGEGTLTAFNVRARRMEMQSELFDNEFLTLAIMKNQKKVVVGAGDGALNIFNWGEFGNISDRYPFYDGTVDVVVPISEDVLCAGCEDGRIRAVQIHPNRVIGVIGRHGHSSDASVEGLSVSHDRKFVASCSYNNKVKFHSLSAVKDLKEETLQTTKEPDRKRRKFDSTEDNSFFKGLLS